MWILGGDPGEEAGAQSIDQLKTLVTERGGEVTEAEPWGRRTLSYPIRKFSEGAYFLAKFSVAADKAPEIDRTLIADQSVIRHLLIRDEPQEKLHQSSKESAGGSD